MSAPVRKPTQMEEARGEFRRVLQSTPGFPLTPNYGQRGMDLRFVLIGELGATQFLMFTDWVPREPKGRRGSWSASFPMAADLGFHWKTNPWGDADFGGKMPDCDWLGGAGCYYDGSGLNAEPVMARFIAEGFDAVWEELERYYRDVAGWNAS